MELLVLLGVLVCPLVMGGMMVWMMLQHRGRPADRDHAREKEPR